MRTRIRSHLTRQERAIKVLITGAAGGIGTLVTRSLSDDHDVRGLDLRRPDTPLPGEFVVGDAADPDVALGAVEGVDAVVHLAGHLGEADLPTILRSHVVTTAALLDAMVQHGVGRMVYASSNHAVGMTPRTELLGTDALPRPDTFYGVGKVAAEGLLSLYADRHGIASVAMRIGSFLEAPNSTRALATWLSYGDCVRMVRASLEGQLSGFTPIYGISANTDGWWDLEPGRAIGYRPEDDAADHREGVAASDDDVEEAARVGGSYASSRFARRPFDEAPQ